MRPEDILCSSADGLYSRLGGFHVDPVRPVERALITHGHSDHARAGHGAVLGTQETLDMMRLRYGENFAGSTQAIRYGEKLKIGKTEVSFHPAGHVLGSAQICVAANGTRVVASGDYKDIADPTCAPFELVRCDAFITEATFGLPVFRHGDPRAEIAKLLNSVALFPERAPAWRRAAAGDFRSCRLGWPLRDHRGDRGIASVGDARRRGGAGALVHAARTRGAAARDGGIWRGGRGSCHSGARRRREAGTYKLRPEWYGRFRSYGARTAAAR